MLVRNIKMYRPYEGFSSEAIVEEMLSGFISHDIEVCTYCFEELACRKHNKINSKREKLTAKHLEPIAWLETAAGITQKYKSTTKGHCNVYIILLKGMDAGNPGYALYVGQSYHSPEKRFQQHREGYRAARSVKNYGYCLLPSLYEHLNPMSRSEALQLESDIFEALSSTDIPTYGGH